ncbi:hypothetical protein Pfo_021390 [Paulownia fortunei]|nr:hypothetical protein Pfo_021390 [Paulownia fortunei]
MAFPLKNMILLLEFLLLLSGYLYPRTNSTPLNVVCRRAIDHAFCSNNFGSNTETRTAGLPVLAQLAIDRAQNNGIAAKRSIHSLILLAVDPQLKTLLSQCKNAYVDALNALRIAPDDLKRGLFRDLRLHAGQALDAAKQCETSFKSPFKSPGQV